MVKGAYAPTRRLFRLFRLFLVRQLDINVLWWTYTLLERLAPAPAALDTVSHFSMFRLGPRNRDIRLP